MANKNPYNCTFCRIEKKYMLNKQKYEAFTDAISSHMAEDQYGLSTICNIYFDSKNDDMIRNSLDKPKYKEKLRLRSYGVPSDDDTVFIELKKKFNGVVFKRRVALTYRQAKEFFKTGKKPDDENQIFHEIDYVMRFYEPKSKIYLAYDRVAYYATDNSGIRLTIDKNIRARNFNLSLDEGTFGTPLLDKDTYLLEIKVLDAYPMWLLQIMSELKLYPISFSKYGKIYSDTLRRESNV